MIFYSAGFIDNDGYENNKFFKIKNNAIKYLQELKQSHNEDDFICYIPDKPKECYFSDENQNISIDVKA